MKKAVRILSLLLSLLLLFGCSANTVPTTAPETSGAALESEHAAKTEAALAEISR